MTDTSDDVVTLVDSGDEGSQSSNQKGGEGSAEVVMEYNHNDYADLIGPPKPKQISVPTPVIKATNSVTASGPMKLPKRPGTMPPFALFSQEMRAKLQADEPEIGFGELGRRLGEMWHSLKEEEKEDYRVRAREVADAKMKSWKETVSHIPKHKQLELEQQQPQRRKVMKIKKKKTSGYAIFCSEQRRQYAASQPDLQFSDISKKIAEDWRTSSEIFKKEYEEKALRYNVEEEKKWRQRIHLQQQQQMALQKNRRDAMVKQQQQQRLQQQQQQRLQQQKVHQQRFQQQQQQQQQQRYQQQKQYRQILPNNYIQQQQQPLYRQQQQRQQQQQPRQRQQYNTGNQSGLVISSVSSLSNSPSKDMSGLKLPSGITIHRAEPEINLPSSITISRVEPEIQIVEENIVQSQSSRVQKAPNQSLNHVQPQQRVMSRGRPVMQRGRGQQGMMRGSGRGRPPGPGVTGVLPQMHSMRGMQPNMARGGQVRPRMPIRTNQSPMSNGMSRGGSPMVNRPRMVSNISPRPQMQMSPNPSMKRPMMSPRSMAGMPPLKRARLPGHYGVTLNQSAYSTTGAINPATLAPFDRLCRVCGLPNSVIFKLKEKPEVSERLADLLKLKIDDKVDEEEGYPSVVCRKCCNLVETFFQFNKQIISGQETLRNKVEERRKAKENKILAAEESPSSPLGVDPLASVETTMSEETSIVPDDSQPDTQIGKIKIKQESLKKEVNKDDTLSPFTTVFTDAVDVKIKIEPGIGATTDNQNETADHAFKGLLGEVKKLEEAAEKEGTEKKEPGGDKEKVSADDKEEKESGEEKEKEGEDGVKDTADKENQDTSEKETEAAGSRSEDNSEKTPNDSTETETVTGETSENGGKSADESLFDAEYSIENGGESAENNGEPLENGEESFENEGEDAIPQANEGDEAGLFGDYPVLGEEEGSNDLEDLESETPELQIRNIRSEDVQDFQDYYQDGLGDDIGDIEADPHDPDIDADFEDFDGDQDAYDEGEAGDPLQDAEDNGLYFAGEEENSTNPEQGNGHITAHDMTAPQNTAQDLTGDMTEAEDMTEGGEDENRVEAVDMAEGEDMDMSLEDINDISEGVLSTAGDTNDLTADDINDITTPVAVGDNHLDDYLEGGLQEGEEEKLNDEENAENSELLNDDAENSELLNDDVENSELVNDDDVENIELAAGNGSEAGHDMNLDDLDDDQFVDNAATAGGLDDDLLDQQDGDELHGDRIVDDGSHDTLDEDTLTHGTHSLEHDAHEQPMELGSEYLQDDDDVEGITISGHPLQHCDPSPSLETDSCGTSDPQQVGEASGLESHHFEEDNA